MPKKWILPGVCAIAVGTLAIGLVIHARQGSTADGFPALLQLVPADSTFVAYVNFAEMRHTPLVERLMAMAPPVQTDSDYAQFVKATGFDYQRDLDRVVLAKHGSAVLSQTLAFAEGRFDAQKIQQYALRTGKLVHLNSRLIYVLPSTTPGKNVTLEFLESNRISLSDGPDFSPAATTPTPLDPALRERLVRVTGSPLFVVARIPAPAAGDAANAIPGTNGAAAFQALRWVNFAARPDGSNVLLSAEGECDTQAQAQQMANGLQFLRSVLEGGLSDPKSRGKMTAEAAAATGRLLAAAQISTETTRVRLLVTVTPEMLGNSSGVPTSQTPSTH